MLGWELAILRAALLIFIISGTVNWILRTLILRRSGGGKTATNLSLTLKRRRSYYDKFHLQSWCLYRKIANFERTFKESLRFNEGLALVVDDKAISQHFQDGGSSSICYSRFAQGCRARMGEEVRKDLALDAELIVEVLKAMDQKVEVAFEEGNSTERNKWIIADAYISISYEKSVNEERAGVDRFKWNS